MRPGLPKPEAVLLRLRLIGRMQAMTLNNESVLPLGRKTRGLLAILAMSGRRPVLRSRLAELLWSRRSEEQARASLRQEIHRLLDALSPVGADVVAVERHTLALKPALTSVDAERILNANGNQAEHLPPIEGVLLEELNGTDPALDAWLQGERNRLREHAIGLFEEMLRRQRDTPGTLIAARQLLLLDGLHERAWRAQIQGQLALGETGLALQSAERCAAAFAERHGAEPGPETRRLLAELRRSTGEDGATAAPAAGDGGRPPVPAADNEPGSTALPETGAEPPAARSDRPVRLVEAARTLQRETPHGMPLLTVLPPLDLTGGTDCSILTEGLADNLRAGLASHSRLKLMHGSELHDSLAQGRDDAVLRRTFGIDYVLDGTLQRFGGRLRVILRLSDIRQHGQIVWARRFDGPEADALDLQDTITTQLVAQLPWEIMLVESRRLRHRPVAELDPHGLMTRAVMPILSGDRTQSDRACLLLEQSIKLEPDEPLSHVFSGLAHMLRSLHGWGDPAHEAALAGAEIRTAMALDTDRNPGLAFACLIRSEVEDEPEAALTLIDRTLMSSPGSASAWAASAFPLVRLGRLDEAATRFERYKALFPSHPFEALLDMPGVVIPLLQGRFEEAAHNGALLSELRPSFILNLVPFLSALGHLHRSGDATRIRNRLQATNPDMNVERALQMAGLRRVVDGERLAAGLRLAGLPETVAAARAAAAAGPSAEQAPALGVARMAG